MTARYILVITRNDGASTSPESNVVYDWHVPPEPAPAAGGVAAALARQLVLAASPNPSASIDRNSELGHG
jgi:hypothetical protein